MCLVWILAMNRSYNVLPLLCSKEAGVGTISTWQKYLIDAIVWTGIFQGKASSCWYLYHCLFSGLLLRCSGRLGLKAVFDWKHWKPVLSVHFRKWNNLKKLSGSQNGYSQRNKSVWASVTQSIVHCHFTECIPMKLSSQLAEREVDRSVKAVICLLYTSPSPRD